MRSELEAASPSGSATDADLLQGYAGRRDEDALGVLVRRHWDRLYRLAWRIVREPSLAEDVTQQAFVKAARGGYRGDGTVGGWLTRIVVNDAKNACVARRRRSKHEAVAGVARASSGAGGASGSDPEKRELVAALERHLEALEDDVRLPLILRYSEGLTHEEVGDALGIPSGTASTRLRRGLERLRDSLTRAGFAAAIPAIEGVLGNLPAGPEAPEPPSGAAIGALAARVRFPLVRFAGSLATAGAIVLVVATGRALWPRQIATAPAVGNTMPAGAPAALHDGSGTGASVERENEHEHGSGGSVPRLPNPPGKPSLEVETARATSPRTRAPEGSTATATLLEGYVVSAADGAGVAGADIRWELESDSGEGSAESRSDAQGRFRITEEGTYLRRLPQGEIGEGQSLFNAFEVVVRREGYAPLCQQLTHDEVVAHRPIELRMKPGGLAFEGRVIDRRTRAPLPGVSLELGWTFEGPRRLRRRPDESVPEAGDRVSFVLMSETELGTKVTSDASGLVHLGGLRAGNLVVRNSNDKRYARIERTIAIGPDMNGPVEIDLEEAASIEVEVVGSEGYPVEKAMLALAGADARMATRFMELSSSSGRATIAMIPAAPGYRLLVSAPGHDGPAFLTTGLRADVISEPFALLAGERRPMRIVLPSETSLGTGTTPASTSAPETSSVAGGAAEHEGSGRVAGRIVDADGHPIAGASVALKGTRLPKGELSIEKLLAAPPELRVSRDSVSTDAEGTFEFTGLPDAGAYLVESVASGCLRKEVGILPPGMDLASTPLPPGVPQDAEVFAASSAQTLTIRLERSVAFAVDVHPPAGLEPQRLALEVRAELLRSEWRTLERPTIDPLSSGLIRVRFDGVAASSRGTVVLYVPGIQGLIVRDAIAGETPREVAFPSAPGAMLRGRLLFADGRPAAGAAVYLRIEDSEGALFSAVADGEGQVVLTDLPREKLTLSLQAPSKNAPKKTIDVDARTETDLGEIRLEPAPGTGD